MAQQLPQGLGAPVGGRRVEGDVWAGALRWASRNPRILAPLTTLVVMFVFFSIVTDVFLTRANLQNVVTQVGPIAVAAAGITFVLLCAEIDLSIASVATYAGMLATYWWIGGEINLVVTTLNVDLGNWGLVLAVAVAAVLGLINGVLVAFVGIPVIGLVALGVLVVGELVLQFTRFGRYVYMTGGNREAAELSGVDTRRVVMLCLTICGFTAGIAGLLT